MNFKSLALAGLMLACTFLGYAQNQLIIVPFDQNDPNLPHPTYEGAPITLKAILRDASCSTYQVTWDVNLNGSYGDEVVYTVGRDGNTLTVRSLGRTYLTPQVSENTLLEIGVRVVNNCSGQAYYGTMRLFVHDFTPDANPANWTDEQVEVMSAVAASEAMWYTHRYMTGLAIANVNSTIRGTVPYYNSTPTYLKMFLKNGHLPALPPNTINSYSMTLPATWASENNARWNNDPYAETVMRMINYVALNSFTQMALPSGTTVEDSTIGYDVNQVPVYGSRIPGTRDGLGVYFNQAITDRGLPPNNAELVGALVDALPALAGTPVQHGSQQGKSWEFVLQQMIDYIADAQVDGGSALGHFYYSTIHGSTSNGTVEALPYVAYGMYNVEQKGAAYDLVVPNILKYRVANAILSSQTTNGAAKRFAQSPAHSNQLTAGMMGVCRWLGVHEFSDTSTVVPFPNEAPGITRAQLRGAYDDYEAYITPKFTTANLTDGYNWEDGFWRNGDYLCGASTGVYNIQPDFQAMTQQLLSDAFRIGDSVKDSIGVYNWQRMFNISLIRGQKRLYDASAPAGTVYNQTGYVQQMYCVNANHVCAFGGGWHAIPFAVNILTPDDFEHEDVVGCWRTYATVTETACDSFTWSLNAQTYTATGSYLDTIPNAAGCDSVITLQLTVNYSNTGAQTEVACDSFAWSANSMTYFTSGTYVDTLTNADGCDSVVTLNLTVNYSAASTQTEVACDSFAWNANNVTYFTSGTYVDTLTTSAGCDSVVTLALTVNYSNSGTQTEVACDSYTWPANSQTYTVSGTYVDTLTNAAGCDSVVTLNLTVNYSTSATQSAVACDSYTWSVNAQTYTVGGTYVDTLTNAVGCDSVITLNLTVNYSSTGSQTEVACDSYTWSANNITYFTGGTYVDTLTNATGCDSVVTLNLTVNYSNTGSQTEVACDSFTWSANNTTYFTGGTYVDTLTNASGCDSVVTLNLTVNYSNSGSQTEVACDSYTWSANNITYFTGGNYVDTLTNASGCDSVVTLNLTVNYSNSGSQTEVACDSFAWSANNMVYFASGTYVDTLTNASGCDSVVTLNLTVNYSNTGLQQETVCESYTWPADGQTYTSSGLYTTTLTNASGCDSVVTLDLLVNTTTTAEQVEEACLAYTWPANGSTYTTSGTYVDTLTNAAGCDSIVTLSLTVQQVDTNVTQTGINLEATATGAQYQWLDCDNGFAEIPGATQSLFVPTLNGTYAVRVTQDGCSDTSACYVVDGVGIFEQGQDAIALYPNPTRGTVYLDFGTVQERCIIRLYATTGQLIEQHVLLNNQHMELTLDQPAGMYFIEVSNGIGAPKKLPVIVQ